MTNKKGPCPSCNSSDAHHSYDDGHSYCYSCETRFSNDTAEVIPMNTEVTPLLKSSGKVAPILDRKISRATAHRYNTMIQLSGDTITHHIYKYFDEDNNHIANKVRNTSSKKFWSEGNISRAGLFGLNIFNQAGNYITVCEGEIDAMTA